MTKLKRVINSPFVKDVKKIIQDLKVYFGISRKWITCSTGSVPGSECHKKLIFKNFVIGSNDIITAEILAGRAGAFKVRKMQILVRRSNDLDCYASIEIGKIYCSDCPQTINYQKERSLSDVFKEPVDVDFMVFGAREGEGLKIEFYNPNHEAVNVYVTLWGDAATSDLLGKA